MYQRRRQRRPAVTLISLLLLGTFAGVIFLTVNALRAVQRTTSAETNLTSVSTILLSSPTPLRGMGGGGAPATASPAPRHATLFIPGVGISAAIITAFLDGESWNVSQLGGNVGHLQGTAWLGTPGNLVLAGHVTLRDGSRGIFAAIAEMQPGDSVYIIEDDVEWHYQVVERRNVAPNDLSVLYPTEAPELTLITCDSYDFFSDSYLERVVVQARWVPPQ